MKTKCTTIPCCDFCMFFITEGDGIGMCDLTKEEITAGEDCDEYKCRHCDKEIKMTKKEIKENLQKCIDSYKKTEEVFNGLEKYIGSTVESPLFDVIYATFETYVDVLEKLIGDDFNWVSWYIWDNSCGYQELAAKASNWKRLRKIKTVNDLTNIIWADLNESKKEEE